MKKIIMIGFCILIIMNLNSLGITLDSLSVNNKIEKNIIGKIELKKVLSKDSIILFPSENKLSIDGISVSGTGKIFSDTSLIRIIVVDDKNNEYLIYESTILSDEIGKIQFFNRADETYLIESFVLQKVIIQLINAEVEINDLTYYNCIEKDKYKRELLRDNLKKEIADKKLKIV